MLNRLQLAAIACLLVAPAFAQQPQLSAGQMLGNDTAAARPARAANVTAVLDRAFGAPSVQGSILNRGASAWSATSTPVLGLAGTTAGTLGFENATSGRVTFVPVAGALGSRTVFIPAAAGTLAVSATAPITLSALGAIGITGAALTKTDDTNVTLTLGGTPASALVNAVSLTLGWTGTLASGRLNANVVQAITNDTNVTASISAQNLTLGWTGTLSVARGGTGSGTASGAATNIFPVATRAGDVIYWNGSTWVTLAGNNSGTNVLQENASGVPSWVAPSGTGTIIGSTGATDKAAIRANGVGGVTIQSSAMIIADTTGALSRSGGGGIPVQGTNTNDSAAAGDKGEYIESVFTTVTNYPASASVADATSISLTAGDWDVTLIANSSANGATAQAVEAFIGTVAGNNTTGLILGSNGATNLGPQTNFNVTLVVPSFRMSLAGTTTIYAKVLATYTVGTPQYSGVRISGRRVR